MRAIWNVLKSRARRRRGAIIRADNAMSASIYLHNADVGKTFLYIFLYYTINCRYNEQNINTRRSFYESEVVRKRRQLAFLFVTFVSSLSQIVLTFDPKRLLQASRLKNSRSLTIVPSVVKNIVDLVRLLHV